MKYILHIEKFKEKDFLDFKKEEESKILNNFGDKNLEKFCLDSDYNGLNFLFNNGYSADDYEGDNPFVIAVNNLNIKLLEYLIPKISFGYKNPINSIVLSKIIEESNIGKDDITKLKIITKYGYNFGLKNMKDYSNINYISLYLCKYDGEKNIIISKLEPFIDWLLEYYPDNYILCRDVISDKLRKKHIMLEDSFKYNL